MRVKPEQALQEVAAAIDTKFGMRSEHSVSGLFKSRPVVVQIAPVQSNSTSYTGGGIVEVVADIAFTMFANSLPKTDFELKITAKCESPLIFDLTLMNMFTEEFKFGSMKRWLAADDRYKPACRGYFNNPDVNGCITRLLVEQEMYSLTKTASELICTCGVRKEYEGVYDALEIMWWLSDALERVPA